MNLRIEKAKYLLETTKNPISQISESLCFYDQYIFSKAFKNKVGLSPNQYRKQIQNNN